MNLCDLAPEYIQSIAPYQPGKPISELAREMGLDEHNIVKLASNENPFGTSPLALEAMINALDEVKRYPDGNGFELKTALSKKYDVDSNQIVLGNGSNDVLELAARVFLKPGTSAIYSQHAFAVYPLVTQAVGAEGISVPAKDFGHDLNAMLDAVTPETRVIYIANPNNPTGTFVTTTNLLSFLKQISPDILVVLDEAYNEYLPEASKADSIEWLDHFPNLLITRTFSKIYGMAGIRVGFGLAHAHVADLMNRIRQPFNVNSIGLVGALAAINDVGRAPAVYQELLKQGVIVRPLGIYEMPQHLRVTIGLESENYKFLQALEKAIQ